MNFIISAVESVLDFLKRSQPKAAAVSRLIQTMDLLLGESADKLTLADIDILAVAQAAADRLANQNEFTAEALGAVVDDAVKAWRLDVFQTKR